MAEIKEESRERALEKTLDLLAKDMKVVIDEVYSPLTINVESYVDEGNTCLEYYPPFYLEDKCNAISFGVTILSDEPKYPLRCTSEYHNGEFIVQSANDWCNHTDKFVLWKDEITSLIKKIRM